MNLTPNLFASNLLKLPRGVKKVLLGSLDFSSCVLASWLSLGLRYEVLIVPSGAFLNLLIYSTLLYFPVFLYFGLYRALSRYSDFRAYLNIFKAFIVYCIFGCVLFGIVKIDGVPRSLGLIQPLIFLMLVLATRGLASTILAFGIVGRVSDKSKIKILIYGVTSAGRQLAASVYLGQKYKLVGFLDNNSTLWKSFAEGVPIFRPSDVFRVVQDNSISEIWLALSGSDSDKRSEVIESMRGLKVRIRSMHNFYEHGSGNYLHGVEELDVADLLGRNPVNANLQLLERGILDQVVMVTGAGGSIGSELCRQIIEFQPKTLVLIDQSEFALYKIHTDILGLLRSSNFDSLISESTNQDKAPFQVVPILSSVADDRAINELFERWRPDTVFHAAAYKHVPLVEKNIVASISNNVWGTLCCIKSAIKFNAKNFVLISTDKAVRPTNVMGATKRLSELVMQAYAAASKDSSTILSAVRFGNVLDSSGSVVPLFRKQILEGGPLTLTHPDITRYFMTIPEAAQLVVQACSMASGGDIFVLDMGEPVPIMSLARRMIEFSGLTVKDAANESGDIEILVTGLRPGEKLYEELLIGGNPVSTGHPKIMKARESYIELEELNHKLNALLEAMKLGNMRLILDILIGLVPEYNPSQEVEDWSCSSCHVYSGGGSDTKSASH